MKQKRTRALFIGAIILIAFRLYLPVLVKNYVNTKLNQDPNYRGSISEVDLHIWRGAYSVFDLKIEHIKAKKAIPFLAIKKIDIGISWQDILKRTFVARVDLHEPVVNFVKEAAEVKIGGDTNQEKKAELNTWQDVFRDLIPLDISRLEISNGSLRYRDFTTKPQVDVYIDQLEVHGSNLTNSDRLSETLFGNIHLWANVMKTGKLEMKILVNPISKPLAADVDVKLEGLALTNLNDLFTAYGNFDVKKGTFNFYSEVALRKQHLKGYVKPLVHDLQVSKFSEDIKKGLGHAIWQKIVGLAGFFLKNHAKDQQGVVFNFEGNASQPDLDEWAAIGSILKNIFVKALPPGINNSVQLNDVK